LNREKPLSADHRLFACLLHADVHPITFGCWEAAVDWYFTCRHRSSRSARDAYQAEVERRLLDRLLRTGQLDSGPSEDDRPSVTSRKRGTVLFREAMLDVSVRAAG
jgi:hypothetical protein